MEAQVARCEIKLFVIQRVVGNVHLSVTTRFASIRIEDHGCIVVDTRGATLKERSDDDHAVFLGGRRNDVARWTRNGFRQRELIMILALARILAGEQLLKANDVSTSLRGLFDLGLGDAQIRRLVRFTCHLHERDDAV